MALCLATDGTAIGVSGLLRLWAEACPGVETLAQSVVSIKLLPERPGTLDIITRGAANNLLLQKLFLSLAARLFNVHSQRVRPLPTAESSAALTLIAQRSQPIRSV